MQKLLLLLCSFVTVACRKPYQPKVVEKEYNYLVVEGVINTGTDSTIIKLSRTTKLDAGVKIHPESRAIITVESDANDSYPLHEVQVGTYGAFALNLPLTKKYRLHVVTENGEEYRSAFVDNAQTPEIDSVNFVPQKTGIQLFVTTHDDGNKTRYYRWDYDETWTYFSPIGSQIYYHDRKVSFRPTDSLITECYKRATPSNSIFIATSNKLSKDVISEYPLGYVDASTGKISHVYSAQVKQYAISPEAYTYWTLLKKNTEQLGSIFDAQPSTLIGNIKCISNPNEPVIGYISASTIKTKRIFVTGNTLPFHVPDFVPPPDPSTCVSGFISKDPEFTLIPRLETTLANGDTLLTFYRANPATNGILGYEYATADCVDCRMAGGTSVKPAYWPF